MLDEASATVPTLDCRAARRLIRETPGLTVLDVRDSEEYAAGHIGGSLNISRGGLEFYVEEALPDRAAPLLVVSRAGARALLAARTLQELGYRAVWALEGGLETWRSLGYALEREGERRG